MKVLIHLQGRENNLFQNCVWSLLYFLLIIVIGAFIWSSSIDLLLKYILLILPAVFIYKTCSKNSPPNIRIHLNDQEQITVKGHFSYQQHLAWRTPLLSVNRTEQSIEFNVERNGEEQQYELNNECFSESTLDEAYRLLSNLLNEHKLLKPTMNDEVRKTRQHFDQKFSCVLIIERPWPGIAPLISFGLAILLYIVFVVY